MTSLLPRPRRAKFSLSLHVLDLHNVPLVSGQSFVKWHLSHSSSAEHRGQTSKAPIADHRVTYDYHRDLVIRLAIGKDNVLQPCWAEFEVLQEYGVSIGGRGERIVLGKVRLNLAEYVGVVGEEGEEGKRVVRRYLMQDSKINSTLRLGIGMQHLEGTRDYTAPPLRSAPVFGGIAGIISAEAQQGAGDDALDANAGPMPSLSVRSKEVGELQDMYRRSLAAFWASQPGELKADECIEDIFSGGDGWGASGRPDDNFDSHSPARSRAVTPGNEDEKRVKAQSHKTKDPGKVWGNGSKTTGFGRKKVDKSSQRVTGELDEFEVREDLRSWKVGSKAMS